MNTKQVPVLLLTGYLGSGKTTLVNHILSNKKGIKFAVIVNDIGEVNIDADLIQKGGVVGKKDDSLVALQNGCICCTLKMDLIEQLNDILKMGRFDYIVIEASGICEPEPIAQTICSIPRMGKEYTRYGIAKLDCIATVVDALRLQSEFGCGDNLTNKQIDEEDIENLIIQQIEFCNVIVLNKVSEVKPEELVRIKGIIRTLQPGAEIYECDYANIDLDKLIHTGLFDFERVATSAGWVKEIERPITEEEEEEDEHEHHHDHDEHEHHHDHDEHEHHHDHGEGCTCGCHDHDHEHGHHHADDVFTSWGKETPHKFERAKLEEILKQFVEDDKILRSKGMVEGTDGKWIYFDMVPGEYEIRDGEPDYTGRIVVIGTDIHEHELEELFGLA